MSQVLHLPLPPTPKRKLYICIALIVIITFISIAPFVWLFLGRVSSNTGTIATHLTPINALMSSSITEILVEPGAIVQAGQILARLDGTAYASASVAARALVRSSTAHSTPQTHTTQARIQAAQEAEEHMVQQVALARHEENAQRALVEQRSTEHAKALMHMRTLNVSATPSSAKARQDAEKAEQQASQKLTAAQDAFTLASRSRTATEKELRTIRNNAAAMHNSTQNTARNYIGQNHIPSDFDPTVLKTPSTGRLGGLFPALEQKVHKGQTVFQLMPEGQINIWATALFDASAAKNIEQGQLCYVLPMHDIGEALYGTVKSVSAPINGETTDTTSVVVTIALHPTSLSDSTATLIQTRAQVVIWQHTVWGMDTLRPLLQLLSYI